MPTDWPSESRPAVIELAARGFPAPAHRAEAGLFCRQEAMPGHDQAAIEAAHFAVIGCGGLGGWMALGLARMGARRLTLFDPDRFDRTNAPRQLAFPADLGELKAHAVARRVIDHMTNEGTVRAVAMRSQDSLDGQAPDASVLAVGVDNSAARLHASAWARARARAAVFAMLSEDGMRAQVFLQGREGPCLSDVLPDIEPRSARPCAAASVASCWVAASHAVALAAAAAMAVRLPRWRETSLNGHTERAV